MKKILIAIFVVLFIASPVIAKKPAWAGKGKIKKQLAQAEQHCIDNGGQWMGTACDWGNNQIGTTDGICPENGAWLDLYNRCIPLNSDGFGDCPAGHELSMIWQHCLDVTHPECGFGTGYSIFKEQCLSL